MELKRLKVHIKVVTVLKNFSALHVIFVHFTLHSHFAKRVSHAPVFKMTTGID